MPELPYALEALAPKMSAETFEYHYGKHLQTYVDNLNRLIAGTPYEEMSLEEIIRKAEAEGVGYKATVEQMYYGDQQFLFIYEQFDDVRLVAAPPSTNGKFGGDTDN